MNTRLRFVRWNKPAAAAILACSLVPAQASVLHTNTAAGTAISTPIAVHGCIPKSVFVVPHSPKEGRDPFFPRSGRLFGTVASIALSQTNHAFASVPILQLKGFSGTPAHRLAIINNITFASGEEGDVFNNGRRVRVRCLEIKEDAVVVLIGGERRELRLRSGI